MDAQPRKRARVADSPYSESHGEEMDSELCLFELYQRLAMAYALRTAGIADDVLRLIATEVHDIYYKFEQWQEAMNEQDTLPPYRELTDLEICDRIAKLSPAQQRMLVHINLFPNRYYFSGTRGFLPPVTPADAKLFHPVQCRQTLQPRDFQHVVRRRRGEKPRQICQRNWTQSIGCRWVPNGDWVCMHCCILQK